MKKFLFIFAITSSAFCVDLPTFYRVPLFQGETKITTSNWTTHIDAQFAIGSSHKSWNSNEIKAQLFDAFGPFDLRKLAANLEDLASKPKTLAYSQGSIPTLTNGKLAFGGYFKLKEYNFMVQQNLLWGLYAKGYLPARDLKLSDIMCYKAVETDAEHQQLINFVNNDLNGILEENGISPLKTEFHRTQIADPLVSIGWQGNTPIHESTITAIRGSMEMGVVFPNGSKKDIDRVFSIPTAYNKHWGVNGRGNLHVTLWKKLVLGTTIDATTFFKETYDQRLTTSANQNGYIILERGHATTDPGSLWDVTVYAKGERIAGGLSVLLGYSFVQQEATRLSLKDDRVLKTALEHNLLCNKDEVINSNKMLQKWYQHTLHMYAEYDFNAHNYKYAPTLQIAYNYPLSGQHSWPTSMTSGNFNMTFNWSW